MPFLPVLSRSSRRVRRRAIAMVSVAVVVAAGLATAWPSWSQTRSTAAIAPVAVYRGEQLVTLITGDRVHVQVRPKGQPVVVAESGARRRGIGFIQYELKGHQYVIPVDAAPLVAQGQLDQRLFDVTNLLAAGYSDGERRDLPLLVSYTDGASLRGAQTRGLGSATTGRTFHAASLQAMAAPKAQTETFWDAITTTTPGKSERNLRPGIKKVWLDGKVSLSIDRSVAHVGAPTAWARGLDGAGVPVAVLDTGYDPNHPDFAGAVRASQNFTNDPDGIVDTIGHGTHVASILAGRGTASAGRYKGVAPKADLLIGKVCADTEASDSGPCPESAIIAGMEWAAESGARVVNMSLGGGPTDGTDPLASEVDLLSARYGTLFVISAGNHPPFLPGKQTVSTPAAANAALAVANLERDDTLNPSSNEGPRFGDFALKPDLAAPGTDIVAARATQGYLGDPVDDNYVSMTGTSMSSPHVAGAAAILAQQHPAWKADELKAALQSSASPVGGLTAYQQGSGLVDAARATAQQVWASPGSLSMGHQPWPNAGAPPITKTVTYRNDSASAAVLSLSIEAMGPAVPHGLFSVDSGTVTVPANGSANVLVTANTQAVASAFYSAQVVARSADGSTVVRTSVGVSKEPESHDLTVSALDRNGVAPQWSPFAMAVGTSSGEMTFLDLDAGSTTVRLPLDTYVVVAATATGGTTRVPPSITLGVEPGVNLTGNIAISFDSRRGRAVRALVDHPDAVSTGTENLGVNLPATSPMRSFFVAALPGSDVYAIPSGTTAAATSFFDTKTLVEPEITVMAEMPRRRAIRVAYVDSVFVPHFSGERELSVIDGGQGTAEDLSRVDARGKLVTLTLDQPGDIELLAQRVSQVEAAGGVGVLLTTYHRPSSLDAPLALPVIVGLDQWALRLAAAAKTTAVEAEIEDRGGSRYQYNLVFGGVGGFPSDLTYRVRDNTLAAVRTRYASLGVADAMGTIYTSSALGGWISPVRIALPATRTEYFSVGDVPGRPGEPLTWGHELRHESTDDRSGPWGSAQRARRGPYQVGNISEAWNVGPFGPAIDPSVPAVAAVWGGLLVDLPLFSDGVAGHFGDTDWLPDFDSGDVVVRRDGTEIGRSDEAGRGFFDVSVEPGRYEVVATANRAAPWSTLDTSVRASWVFPWADPTKDPAMLAVRFSADLDEHNRAAAGKAMPLRVWVDRSSTASAVASLSVEVSYDRGATWTKLFLRRDGAGWTATVNHPRQAGVVSLRATARDKAGNSVSQEVIGAYAVG